MPKNTEIERKFKVLRLPRLYKYRHFKIQTGYLSIDGTGEWRVRQEGRKYFLTYKNGRGMTRKEINIRISRSHFAELWPKTDGARIFKTRYLVPIRYRRVVHLDIYEQNLAGLVTAEVEFGSYNMAKVFTPPDWFGEEVTEDDRYKNAHLARHGLPPQKPPVPVDETGEQIPAFDLDKGLRELTETIYKKYFEVNQGNPLRPVIVAIAGGSASGKTSKVAEKLVQLLQKKWRADSGLPEQVTKTISLDMYYHGIKHMQEKAAAGAPLNWDQPEAVNLRLAADHLRELREGKEIRVPSYDFKTGISTLFGSDPVKPTQKVIIIEGLFALDWIIAKQADIKVFVEIGVHGRILRRLLRDIDRTGQRPADILDYFSGTVQPMHEKYIESTKSTADLIIVNEYRAKIEADKSGLHEVQVKYRGTITEAGLRKVGADLIGITNQVDYYYDPPRYSLVATDEMLRIRWENSRLILTYKGPKTSQHFRERARFEFEINRETRDKFLAIYGPQVRVIKKERTLYHKNGIIVALDHAFKVVDGKKIELGFFVELRARNENHAKDKMRRLIDRLGFKGHRKIQSYFEM